MAASPASAGEGSATSDAPNSSAGRAVLGTDLHCVKCQYNLRGLSSRGKCPECGLRILASLSTRGCVNARQWRSISKSLVLVMAANTGLALTPFAAIFCVATFRLPTTPTTLASLIALAVMIAARTIGYARFARVISELERQPLDWDSHHVIRSMSWLRTAAAVVVLGACFVALSLAIPRVDGLMGPLVVIAFVVYCGAGFLQFHAVMYALMNLSFRSTRPSLGKAVDIHNALCVLGVLPGILVFGAGLVLTWLSYHILLARFAVAARRFSSVHSELARASP